MGPSVSFVVFLFIFVSDVFGGVLHKRVIERVDRPSADQGRFMGFQDSKKTEFKEGEPLNELDFINGNKLDLDDLVRTLYKVDEDPIMKAGLFEGDIQGVSNISDFLLEGRNSILDMNLRWPSGTVPYVISSDFSSSERSVIARAMSDYHSNTCIRFVPRLSHDDYIYIAKGHGCSSAVGRQGGGQQVSLGNGCVYHGIVVHELMHAVGFWHEQSRADRDSFITIVWDNILRGMEYNFQKYSWNYIQNLGESYDLGSVMHYDAYAFTAHRGQPTILSKDRNRNSVMGQRRGFSNVDISKINKLYVCEGVDGSGSKKIPVVVPEPVVTKPDKGDCVDTNSQCSGWAKIGECDQNPTWMKANCMKSCGVCGGSCKDHSFQCKTWARSKECTKNPNYMKHYCKKSCKTC